MSKKVNRKIPKLRFPEFEGDWNISTIEQIASVSSGGTPSRTESTYWNGDIPWVTTSEINQTEIFDSVEKITQKGLESSSAKLFKKNTILIAMYGQGKTRGQVSILRIEATTNQACAAITLFDTYNPEFICYFLSKEYENLRLLSNDGSQKNLSAGLIKQYKVSLTSLAEQEKIVIFLRVVDTRISQLRRKHELLQTYKRGVMQKIFSQQIRFKCDRGKPFPDWEKKKLGEFGKLVGGGTPDTSNQEYWNGDIPWVSSSDISENSIHQISITRFINEIAIKESATKIIPPNSILIISRVGVGKIAVSEQELCTSQDFSNFTPNNGNIYFLAYWFIAQKKRLLSIAQGTSIKGFTIHDLSLLKVDFPCIKEQEKIAGFLTAIDQKIEAVAKQIELTEKFKKGLLQKMFV
jgi:type I restriction enzyme S subunit